MWKADRGLVYRGISGPHVEMLQHAMAAGDDQLTRVAVHVHGCSFGLPVAERQPHAVGHGLRPSRPLGLGMAGPACDASRAYSNLAAGAR